MVLLRHILRLDSDTPPQKGLKYYVNPHKLPVGRPPLTWIALITKDFTQTLKHHNIKTPLNRNSLDRIILLPKDNCAWRKEIVWNMGKDICFISQSV